MKGQSHIARRVTGIFNRFFSRKLDFRVRIFNVLAMAGCGVSLIATIVAALIGEGMENILINFGSGLLAYGLLQYSYHTGKYRRCYVITIVGIFGGGFTFMFLTSGGLYGAVPYFFVFAVVFTIFMLDGWFSLAFAGVEILYYSGLCLLAYYRPGIVQYFTLESELLVANLFGMITVCIALGVTMFFQIRMYREQQKRLAEQNHALGQINRLKTEFLGNISHELRTPLTVVSAHAQVGRQSLEGRPEQEEALRRMRLIGSETDRMALMVSQILDISRIDEGQMPIDPKPNSIVEIIQITLETYYPVFSKNGNRLLFRTDGDAPEVLCDRGRIMQVLVNLIANASRHTRNGEIRVSVSQEEDRALVTVTDDGDGIAPERLPHIFDRYHSKTSQMADDAPGSDTGTGLGLYISKHIVERHGGEISIESQLGEGTAVCFTLSLVQGR